MIVHRIERTNFSLKVFSFDSWTGVLRCRLFDQAMPDYVLRKLLVDQKIVLPGDRVISNEVLPNSYSAPFKLYIDITDSCNLNCKHCLTKYLNNGNELSIETLTEIARECHELGVFYVKLGGGEPLLHKNFPEILQLFSDCGQYLSLSTNGYAVTDQVAELLARYNVKTTVSIEGPSNIDDEIRGKGHFNVALKALRLLQHHRVNVCLRVTLTKAILDVDIINELVSIAKENHTKVKFAYCRPAGSSLDNDCLIHYSDRTKYAEVIKLLNQKMDEGIALLDEGMMINQPYSLYETMYDGRICGCVNRSMHVNSAGLLSPCVFLGNDYLRRIPYMPGDIYRYWSGQLDPVVQKIRDIPSPDSCHGCHRLCKYECLATRLFFYGNANAADPNCLRFIEKR